MNTASLSKKKEVAEYCLKRLIAWANRQRFEGRPVKIDFSKPRYKNRYRAARNWWQESGRSYPEDVKSKENRRRYIIREWLEEGGKRIKVRESQIFYNSIEWKTLSEAVIKTYGPICMCCGLTREDGVVIVTDHIKPRKKFPELSLLFSNMQVLCSVCNFEKSDKHYTDYRPVVLDEPNYLAVEDKNHRI